VENHEKSQSGMPYPGRDLNPGPPDYDVGVLTTRPRRSILCLQKLRSKKENASIVGVVAEFRAESLCNASHNVTV
jgi:hypothetical protein